MNGIFSLFSWSLGEIFISTKTLNNYKFHATPVIATSRLHNLLTRLVSLSPGPKQWHEKFPLANGVRQSPVNITTKTTRASTTLSQKPLRWKYIPENTKCLINPGYCWRVDINGKGSELTGGPLNDDIYIVEQFHCHWGCSDGRGSEHTVDGQAFSGELHIVHWNSSKYASFHEAAGHPDGLAVLGVFMKVNIEARKILCSVL